MPAGRWFHWMVALMSHKLVGLGAAAVIAGAVGTAAATGDSSAHGKPHVTRGVHPRVPPEVPKEPSYPIQIPAGAEDPAAADATGADERARRYFPRIYGDLELTDRGTHVVISLTRLDAHAERKIRGSAPPSEFTFVRARRSGIWLDRLTDRIADDGAAQDRAGIMLIQWGGGDSRSGRVLIQVLNLNAVKARWLRRRYGARNVRLRNGTRRDIPVAVSFGRGSR